MKSFEIENIKKFTADLFAGEVFDAFCVTECSFSTLFTVNIDGHINQGFLGEGEAEQEECDPVLWGQVRALCYEIIKGKRLPIKFRIILKAPKGSIAGFLSKHGLNPEAANVDELFLNIRYEKGKCDCVSGVSLKSFSLDKTLENEWDGQVKRFLSRYI